MVGEILGEAALFVEAHDERAVIAGTDDVLQKSGSRFFFECKAALHGTAYVHEQAEFDGQVGFAAEVEDGLHRLVVVEDGEIGLVQIADEFAVAIGRDEDHVDFIDALLDGEDGLARFLAGNARKSSGVAGVHRNIGRGDDVGTDLGACGNGQRKNGGDRENDERRSAPCQSELVALRHSSFSLSVSLTVFASLLLRRVRTS